MQADEKWYTVEEAREVLARELNWTRAGKPAVPCTRTINNWLDPGAPVTGRPDKVQLNCQRVMNHVRFSQTHIENFVAQVTWPQ